MIYGYVRVLTSAQDLASHLSQARAVGVVSAILGVATKLERRRILKCTARGRIDATTKRVKFGRNLKLTAHQQRQAQARIAKAETQRSVARSYNIGQATISRLAT